MDASFPGEPTVDRQLRQLKGNFANAQELAKLLLN
jgi:hypothetical protein